MWKTVKKVHETNDGEPKKLHKNDPTRFFVFVSKV